MEQIISISDAAPDWEQLRRVLDDAMSELSETDYDALVLRFYQGQDYRTVGAAIGVNDDTAQKRVSRALDKLRNLLAHRGIRTTASALSTLILANAVQAAPVGLAVTISAAALAGTAATTSTLIAAAAKTVATTTLQKTLITAALTVMIGIAVYFAKETKETDLTQENVFEPPIENSADTLNTVSPPQENKLASKIAPTLNAAAPQKPEEARPQQATAVSTITPNSNSQDSEFVTLFRQAIDSPPDIESFAAKRSNLQRPDPKFISSSEAPTSMYFEGAFSGTNYFLRNQHGTISARSEATSYQIGGNVINYGVGSNGLTASVEAEFQVARQILCFGAGEIQAGTVKWNGNHFFATNMVGKVVHGTLEISNNLPCTLQLFLGDSPLPYSEVRYFYETSDKKLSGYPRRFLKFYRSKAALVPLAEVEFDSVVVAKQPLGANYFAEQRFADYINHVELMQDTNHYGFRLKNGLVESWLLTSNRSIKISAE